MIRPAVGAARMAGKGIQAAGNIAQEGLKLALSPRRMGRAAWLGVSATRSLGKLLFIPPDRNTSLRGKCGIEKRAAWTVAIDLEQAKGIGRLMGGTINDVLLSALTGALRRYLELRGDAVDGLNIRGVVPVSIRPANDLDGMGNQFGLVFLSLPVGVRDPLRRLATLKRRMNDIKESPEALVAFGILSTIGLTPIQIEHLIVAIFAMKGTGVLTNVPGPRQPLYYAGQLIDTLMFWVPTPGNLGLGVSIISYNGKVIMGVATDAGLVPDPENILASFTDELEYLQRWGRPPQQEQAVLPVAPDASPPPAAEAQPERCQAVTRAGSRCKNRVEAGQSYCRMHQNSSGSPASSGK
jgi:WS/DGAT/MGAT family acyltransferase